MKKILKVLLLLIFSALIISCSDSDKIEDEDNKLTAESLYQTAWEGDIVVASSGRQSHGIESMIFSTLNSGIVVISFGSNNQYTKIRDFTYYIEDEMIYLENSGFPMETLFIKEINEKKMIFMGYSNHTYITTLNRKDL